MYEYMERLALDALSSAGTHVSLRSRISAYDIQPMPGFGYEMGAIEGTLHNPLRQAFHRAFAVTRPSALIAALRKYIPLISFIASAIQCNVSIFGINVSQPDNPFRTTPEQNGFESLYRIGKELVDEKKEAINANEKDEVDSSQVAGRDLIGALRACVSRDILHRVGFMS